ncbi:MAG: hypothetical protein ACRC1K_21385, partial [Planctomycetia bacterium]
MPESSSRGSSIGLSLKLTVVVLLLVAPIAYLVYSLVGEQNAAIAFAAKEVDGVRYLQQTRGLYDLLLQTAGGLPPAPAAGLNAALGKIQEVDRRLGAQFTQADSGRSSSALAAEVEAAVKTVAAASPADARAAADKALVPLRALIAHVGDASNLILDPDLDSFYVMDAVLVKLPELQQQLSTAVGGDPASKGSAKDSAGDGASTAVAFAAANADSVAAALAGDTTGLPVAFRNDSTADRSTTSKLQPLVSDVQQKVRLALAARGDRQTALAAALSSTFSLWDAAASQLEILLQKRIAGFRARQFTTLAVAV